MKRAAMPLLLCVLLVLAGCAGPLTGGNPTRTTVEHTTRDPALDTVEYPPGVSDSSVNGTTLFNAHLSALENRNFTFDANRTGVNSRETRVILVRGVVGADRDRQLVNHTVWGDVELVYFTGDIIYVRDPYRGDVEYEVYDRDKASGILTVAPNGSFLLEWALTSSNFTATGVTTENGTRLITLTSEDLPTYDYAGTVTQFDGRILVDEQGLVHRASVEYTVTFEDGDTARYVRTVRFSDVGMTDVTEPDWLDEAKAEAGDG